MTTTTHETSPCKSFMRDEGEVVLQHEVIREEQHEHHHEHNRHVFLPPLHQVQLLCAPMPLLGVVVQVL
jgi:hypothetical protein